MKDILLKLQSKQDLSYEDVKKVFNYIFDTDMNHYQVSAFLMGLSVKGMSSDEVYYFIQEALQRAVLIDNENNFLLDTCGTGGDSSGSFNCSSICSIILAAMGIKIAKHGNKAVSSSSGSADIYKALGIKVDMDVEALKYSLGNSNFGFIFAPLYHPGFAKIAPIRKELGVPSIFNIIGPFLNPTQPEYQLVGVSSSTNLDLFANTFTKMNKKKVAIVHSDVNGSPYDELTPFGENTIFWVENSKNIVKEKLNPKDYGLDTSSDNCSDIQDNTVDFAISLLKGKGNETANKMLILNIATALKVVGLYSSWEEAISKAKEAIYSGIGFNKLEELRKLNVSK